MKKEKLRREIGEENYRKAIRSIHKDITDALNSYSECPNRENAGLFNGEKKFYCTCETFAKEMMCRYLGEEKVPVCIDVPNKEVEDYILELGKIELEQEVLRRQGLIGKIRLWVGNLTSRFSLPERPKNRNYMPSHMEEKLVCSYVPLFED